MIDGKPIEGYFTEDFTLAEIKTLRAKERLDFRNQGWNGIYEIPTLQEVIELAKRRSRETGRVIGIYPETKHPSYFRSIGLALEPPLIKTLTDNGYADANAPVFIQSFEVQNLKDLSKLTKVRLVQLMEDNNLKPYDFVVAGDRRSYGDLMAKARRDRDLRQRVSPVQAQSCRRAQTGRCCAHEPRRRSPQGRASCASLYVPRRASSGARDHSLDPVKSIPFFRFMSTACSPISEHRGGQRTDVADANYLAATDIGGGAFSAADEPRRGALQRRAASGAQRRAVGTKHPTAASNTAMLPSTSLRVQPCRAHVGVTAAIAHSKPNEAALATSGNRPCPW
jgi:hypothetical protein